MTTRTTSTEFSNAASEAASVRLASAPAIDPCWAIEVSGLQKRYGQRLAVANLSLRVRRGEALGLLGPNGAGKSTTLLLLAGVLAPDAGRIELRPAAGGPARALSDCRAQIGLAPQGSAVYPELTAEENLRFFARLYGLSGRRMQERVEHSLDQVALTARRHDRVRSFSGGMVRRLNIACALVHEPSVLLLDEPTAGVDPQSRNHIFECLDQLKQSGLTLLFSTHHTAEAERVCDRVAIFDHGRIIALDAVALLLARHSQADAAPASVPPSDRASGERDSGASPGPRYDLESVLLSLTGTSLRD